MNTLDQKAKQHLAVFHGSRFGIPDARQVARQFFDALPVLLTKSLFLVAFIVVPFTL